MLRLILATLAVAAVALPAAAYDTYWDFPVSGTDQDEDITFTLGLNCWIQINWQDMEIHFAPNGVGDWWCAQLENVAYGACPDDGGKIPVDPWAGASYYAGAGGRYYESGDGARIFIRSNNPLRMTVHTNGDLKYDDPGVCPDCYIPTWFTVAAAPIMIGGVWTGVGNIPGDGWGTYLDDLVPGVFGYNDPVLGVHPTQNAFPCAPASQTRVLGPLCPGIEGTLKFLARINRHGLVDPGGNYSTWLDVTFASP